MGRVAGAVNRLTVPHNRNNSMGVVGILCAVTCIKCTDCRVRGKEETETSIAGHSTFFCWWKLIVHRARSKGEGL